MGEPTPPTAPAVLSVGTTTAVPNRPKLKVCKSTMKLNMAKAESVSNSPKKTFLAPRSPGTASHQLCSSNSTRKHSATIKPISLENHDTVGIASREIGSLSTPDISSEDIEMELNWPFDFSGGPPSIFRNMNEEDSIDCPPPTKMGKNDHNGSKEY